MQTHIKCHFVSGEIQICNKSTLMCSPIVLHMMIYGKENVGNVKIYISWYLLPIEYLTYFLLVMMQTYLLLFEICISLISAVINLQNHFVNRQIYIETLWRDHIEEKSKSRKLMLSTYMIYFIIINKNPIRWLLKL